MKITINDNPTLTTIAGCPCRLWEGTTDGGTPVWVFVRLISVSADEDPSGLDRDLIRIMGEPYGRFVPFGELHEGGRPDGRERARGDRPPGPA